MFEHLLRNQVATKYDNHLGDGLTTYRKHNSCETTLIGLVKDWKLARDNRLPVGILSTDMSKAFDSLHLPLMQHKLNPYGFQDRALDLLRSYLCNRLRRVHIGSVTSSWRNVERDCLQGSLLGPLLWNIFRTICHTTRILRYQCTRTIIRSMRKDKMSVSYLPNFRRVPP